jgi:hypothetical protein
MVELDLMVEMRQVTLLAEVVEEQVVQVQLQLVELVEMVEMEQLLHYLEHQ